MKKSLFLIFCVTALQADIYYAKAVPFVSREIKASVSAQVTRVDLQKEGRVSDGSVVVTLDSNLDKINLEQTTQKIALAKELLETLKKIEQNSLEAMQIAQDSYRRIKGLQSYTKVQKDAKKSAYISAKSGYLRAQESRIRQASLIDDLQLQKAQIADRLRKKEIHIPKGEWIDKIYVRKGDVVTMGRPLVRESDLRKAKLVLFLSESDREGILKKRIYLDEKPTDYKIDKLWRVDDPKHPLSYRVEIIIKAPENFSKLFKVSFR